MRTLAAVVALAVLPALSGCLNATHADAVRDLITDVKYGKLLVEVDYVNGFAPRGTAIDLLEQRINERLDKPNGVDVVRTAFASSDDAYTNDELKKLVSKNQDNHPSGDQAVLYVLYLNGHHADDDADGKVLGVQFGYASIAIFKESIDDSGGLPGFSFGAAEVESAVLIHEFGHAIGLVNHGLKMVTPHEDPGHKAHSNNENSVMYWAVENTLGLAGITRTIPNNFDANDIADIRAGGGK